MAKNNGYILALIAGILALLSLIAPIAYQSNPGVDWYLWVWLFQLTKYESDYLDDDTGFLDENDDLVTWGLIVTIIIVIAMIMLLVTGAKAKGSSNNTGVWILAGIMLIVAPILYYYQYDDITNGNFWEYLYDPYIGFFLLIIAGILALVAGFV